MGSSMEHYGLSEKYGRDQSPETFGGAIRRGSLLEVKMDLRLKELENGVSVVLPGVTLPKNCKVIKTTAFVKVPGVGAASFDCGIKAQDPDSTFVADEDGFVGGCPVTDDGDYHEHMDETATAIGVTFDEMMNITFKANGTFTDGLVEFKVIYINAKDKETF